MKLYMINPSKTNDFLSYTTWVFQYTIIETQKNYSEKIFTNSFVLDGF